MLAILDPHGRALSVITGGRAALWVAEVGSVATMVGLASANAGHGGTWPAAIVIVMAALAAAIPDSEAGLVTLLAFGGWWLAVDRSAPLTAVFVAAVASLVFHLSLAHAAAAPAGAVTRVAVLWSLMADAGLVVALTAATAVAMAVTGGAGWHAPSFLIGVSLVLIGLLPWVAATRGPSQTDAS